MADVECNISGLDELEKQLNDLLPKKARRAVHKGTDAGASIVQLAIEASDPVMTGFLRDHEVITTKTSNGEGTVVAKIGPQAKAGYIRFGRPDHGGRRHGSQHIASLYAMWNEFGTKHQPARPVMGPALENNQDRVINAFITAIQNELGGN
jgi:HK97 gp10 family phage protein